MSQDGSNIPRRVFKRKLTPFLCREMLYDYVTGEMDEERRSAVTICLESDRETQEAHEAILLGLKCAEELSRTQPPPDLLQALLKTETAISLGRKYSRWQDWPDSVRWSLSAVGICIGIALIASVFPTNLFLSHGKKADTTNSVVLSEIPKPAASDAVEKPGSQEIAANEKTASEPTESSGDEEDNDKASTATPAPVAAPPASTQAPTPPPVVKPAATPTPQPVAKSQDAPVKVASAKNSDTEADTSESKPKGFVYRTWLKVDDVDDASTKVEDLVRELGGEKAGEVELGWRKGTSSYFHFSLPEKNESEIMERLKQLGRLRFSKDPHSRVMPEGQVRFILWVE